uniref:Link domain-containing protein n=1 Tax=Lates calcarifer TaxID=8187 RepID=A0A4W6FDN8_LATCA
FLEILNLVLFLTRLGGVINVRNTHNVTIKTTFGSNTLRATVKVFLMWMWVLSCNGASRQYTLNFTAARAACLYLNVTIATKDQMEHAVLRGLETCRYGWIAEKIAVIPRLISEEKCGKGNTGLVLWYARAESKFGAYCFSASGTYILYLCITALTTDLLTSSNTSTSPTTPTALTQTSTPTTTPVKSTTEAAPSRKPITIKSPEQQTSLTSASTLLVQTTRSPGISSTSTSLRPFSTSKPAVITSAFSTSLHSSSFSVSSFSVLPQSPSPEKLPLGGTAMSSSSSVSLTHTH